MSELVGLLNAQVEKAVEALDPALRTLLERTLDDCESAIVRVNAEFDEAALYFERTTRDLRAELAEASPAVCRRCDDFALQVHDLEENLARSEELRNRLAAENEKLSADLDAKALRAASGGLSVSAADEDYKDARDEGEAARAQMKASAAEVREIGPEPLADNPVSVGAKQGEHSPDAGPVDKEGGESPNRQPDEQDQAEEELIHSLGRAQEVQTSPPPVNAGRQEREAAVLKAIRGGCKTCNRIASASGVDIEPVRLAVKALLESGAIVKTKERDHKTCSPAEYAVPNPAPVKADPKLNGPWPDIDPSGIDPQIRAAVGSVHGGLRRGVPLR